MNVRLNFLILLPALFFSLTINAQELLVKKNLKSEWMVFENNQYIPFSQGKHPASTIYFFIDTQSYPDGRLQIKSRKNHTVFVNGKVAGSGKMVIYNLDSLSRVSSANTLLVGIYQKQFHETALSTVVITRVKKTQEEIGLRQSASLRDFAVFGSLILISMIIVVGRLNSKLASDYLSVSKMFSLREGEDTKIYSRITSSANILFYLYCSLMISYYLFLIFHFVSVRYPAALSFQGEDFGEMLIQWLFLTGIVLGIFVVKIILVFGLSFLFGIGEVAGVHLFNWVRVLLVFFGLLTFILFVYFISRGHDEAVYGVFLKLVAWIMAAWMILVYLKLASKMSTSMFHLFSYICATELIPFLIIVKVLYN